MMLTQQNAANKINKEIKMLIEMNISEKLKLVDWLAKK